jgi:NADPH:quinone reductase-like Zn-dependent oxidoreductase
MRAVVVDRFGGSEFVRVRDVPAPVPGAGEVLMKVSAAAVNPVDLVTRAGLLHAAGLHGGPPLRLGWDAAGVIVAVGANVRRVRVGQTAIGLSDRLSAPSKTHAEHVVLDEDSVAIVRDSSDLVELSTLPLAGLTAWQALERCQLRSGDSVLITGAAGNVGVIATQLAVLRGHRVFGVGRAAHREIIERLGAEFIDTGQFGESLRTLSPLGVDAAIDAASLGNASAETVRRGGIHVSLNVTERPAPLRGITSTSIAVRADWQQLTILAALYESGALVLPAPVKTYPLTSAKAAHEGSTNQRSVITP